MRCTLHAEWTKLCTMPVTAWLPLVAAMLTVGLSAVIVTVAEPGTTACSGGCDSIKLSFSGVYLGQVAVVTQATLAMTVEYHTGLISTTLTADPRRLGVLAAKAAVVTATALGAGVFGVAGALVAGRILLPGRGFTPANGYALLVPTDGPTMRAAVGTVLYLGLIALLSLGFATVLRDTTRALMVVLGLLYVFPILAQVVPIESWQAAIDRYAPMSAGLAVQATQNPGGIEPWAGIGVLAAYAGIAMLAGAVALATRDP